MRIPLYQVDAFAERVFEGNPAAVCPLDRWLDDAAIASCWRETQSTIYVAKSFFESERAMDIAIDTIEVKFQRRGNESCKTNH